MFFVLHAETENRKPKTENRNPKGGGYAAWATSRKRGKTDPDSHNYEPDESEVWRTHQAQRHFRDRGRCVRKALRFLLCRFLLVGVCACICRLDSSETVRCMYILMYVLYAYTKYACM